MTVTAKSGLALSLGALALAMALTAFPAGPAKAQDPRTALKGDSVRFIVAASAAGSSDKLGRMLAAALQRALPDTSLHVQNREGAGGGVAIAEIEKAAGSLVTLGFANNGSFYIQLSQSAAAPFDLTKLKWIGSVGDNQRLLVMRKNLGPPSLKTLTGLGRQAVIAVDSPGSAGHVESLLLNAMLSLRMKVVVELQDPAIHALLLSGDIDLTLGSYASLKPMIDAGEVVPILLYSKDGAPAGLANVPTLADVVPPGRYDDIIQMMVSFSRSGRIVVASPATPLDKLAALRTAFDVAVADPKYAADMGAGAFVINASQGQDLEERALRFLAIDGSFRTALNRTVECGERMSRGEVSDCQ